MWDNCRHGYWAGHGHACIRLDIRGTGDSEGLITDEYRLSEQDDAVAAIAWIADQPWCSGNVGMTGISWGGFNGLRVAARRPRQTKYAAWAVPPSFRAIERVDRRAYLYLMSHRTRASRALQEPAALPRQLGPCVARAARYGKGDSCFGAPRAGSAWQ